MSVSVADFLIIWLVSFGTILFCRVAPAFFLRGRALSPRTVEALGYIPPAAFAALVANDLVQPAALCKAAAVLSTSPAAAFGVIWPVAMPFIACATVVAVTVKTRSMLGACVTGAVAYLLLSLA